MGVELEVIEKCFAERGEAAPSALDLCIRASRNQRRLLETLGLQRREARHNSIRRSPILDATANGA
jgi:hypothetical protein